ncbi:hypothetical protein Q7C36_017170 [Tachysurus vachellii]|uniref:HSF-type DNA-binding domain-containing protein n=1 Tax=Tachysurus vachellii TaxID=175792 RepID=A0AA88SCS2_TACVA|nr:hypothetical protein Q7C36_017170 [Tachysurus vachellii]
MDSLAGVEVKEACFSSLNKLSNFPGKLWHLVNDPEVCSVCWDASGEGILIYEQAFNAEVLMSQTRKRNAYFKTTHFTSFVRQLNLYGFRKLPPNRDVSGQQLGSFDVAEPHHFCNPKFKREKPELVVTLKRLTPVNKAKLHAGIPLTSRSSKCFHHAMFISPQENSAVMREGSVLVGHQETPYPHRMCLSPVSLYTNEHVPVSELYDDVPCSHPSSSMLGQQSILPHHSQYGFCTPGDDAATLFFL